LPDDLQAILDGPLDGLASFELNRTRMRTKAKYSWTLTKHIVPHATSPAGEVPKGFDKEGEIYPGPHD
jgi:hypothetical protein